jgi:hypothetical protein
MTVQEAPESYYKIGTRPEPKSDNPQGEMIHLLRSIRSMMIFFVVLTIIGLIGGGVLVAHVVSAASNSGF